MSRSHWQAIRVATDPNYSLLKEYVNWVTMRYVYKHIVILREIRFKLSEHFFIYKGFKSEELNFFKNKTMKDEMRFIIRRIMEWRYI